ncbi:MAG: hypothetical protein AB8G22_12335 [Saprospiraceae bacterium]
MKNLIAAFLFLSLFVTTAFAGNAPVNGRNANTVEFASNGQTIGAFIQTAAKEWKEDKFSGNDFNFTEVMRDEWSVYLRDASRGVNIQLDLHTKKVMYSDDQGNAFPLYTVTRALNKVNGYLTCNVTFSAMAGGKKLGTFAQVGAKQWKEIAADPKGNDFNFTEVARDQWSVYLRDASRGVNIQLDLHTRKVMYNVDGGSRVPLYKVMNAR